MNSWPSLSRAFRRCLLAAASVGIVSAATGCSDAADDPMAALLAGETRAALDPGRTLPDLAGVWIDSGGRFDDAPLTRWEDSWALPTSEGRGVRALIYRDAAPALLERLGPGTLELLLVDVDSTLARVDRLAMSGIPDRIRGRIDSARDLVNAARLLAERGERAASLGAVLRASDSLREITPRHVASRLLATAQDGVRRFSVDGSYSEETMERVTRLVDASERAVSDGEYLRAIHGAYYACLLLGIELPN